MSLSLRRFFISFFSFAVLAQPLSAQQILACGDDQVRRYDVDEGGVHEIWRWSAAASPDLPEAWRSQWLRKIDECKPVSGGREILITSSTNGVALIDTATGRARFRAIAPMAHSADMLPNDRLAVALSVHEAGDRLEIYDLSRSETPLFHLPLPSGHGVVWDEARQRLFALSHDYIQAFALVEWDGPSPRLRETRRWRLPGEQDGHDLSPDTGGEGYFVTTADGAWRFDPESGDFTPLKPINPARSVKAVSVHETGALAWVQAEERWWAYGFSILDKGRIRRIDTGDMHLYKVRWAPEAPRP